MRDKLYCLFLPHPKNNHRANFLHHKALVILIAFFVFSSIFFPSSFNPFAPHIRAFADISVTELLNFTNQERERNGLADLKINSQLTNAAQAKADDMFAKNYWAHNSPDGTTPWVFIKNAGYDYVYAGENLARGFNSAQDVVNAWIASPDHRANLLSPNFKDVGFAVKGGKLSGEETFLVVQEFGSKEVPVIPATIYYKPTKEVLGFNISNYFSNRPTTSSEIIILAILFFVGIIVIDGIIVKRKKVIRVVGHNLDHAFYMALIILIVAIFGFGQAL